MKAIDVVKPVCPNWHQHYQLRKWANSLPTQGWFDDDYAYLIVRPTDHPCDWYLSREDTLTPTVRGFMMLGRAIRASSITICK